MRLGFYVTGAADSSYEDLLAQAELADRCGFHAVWLRERHFHRDHGGRNFFPSPLLVAAHIAERAPRLRLGIGARLLALDHPLRIAEDAATVDILSGGRLDLGIARIGEQELYQQAFGTSGEHARERFEESLEIVIRAWSGEPFAFAGRHWRIPEVAVRPTPLQKPHPPIFLVGISEATLRFGAERGFPLLLAGAQPVDLVARTQGSYYELLEACGRRREDISLPLNRFIYVAEDDRTAESDLREAVIEFIGREGSVIRDFLGLPPEEITYERLMEDVFIAGSPERCTERILALREAVDLRDLVLTFNYFSLDHRRCLASMERFLERVAPSLPEPEAALQTAAGREQV